MANRVDGYDIAYTHRGSWMAHRSYRGKLIDEVPVAWDRDYSPGKPPQLVVWFKGKDDAGDRLHAGSFVAAMAKKKPGGASSDDIIRLFELNPIEILEPSGDAQSGLRCEIIGKATPPA